MHAIKSYKHYTTVKPYEPYFDYKTAAEIILLLWKVKRKVRIEQVASDKSSREAHTHAMEQEYSWSSTSAFASSSSQNSLSHFYERDKGVVVVEWGAKYELGHAVVVVVVHFYGSAFSLLLPSKSRVEHTQRRGAQQAKHEKNFCTSSFWQNFQSTLQQEQQAYVVQLLHAAQCDQNLYKFACKQALWSMHRN